MINYPSILGAPEIQASDLVVSEVSDTQFRVTIGNLGNGYSVLIVIKASSSGLTRPLFNNTYTANSVFGSGSDLGQGNYVVGKGVSTVLVTGLSASTTYNIYAYGFNVKGNGTEKYNITTATLNPVTQATLAPQVAPTVQATNLTFRGDRTADCTAGNGAARLWLYNLSGAINGSFLPVDNTTYTVGQNLGGGNIVGGVGASTRFYILDLPFSTSVAHRVFEYNVGGGNPKYNTNTATGNPLVQDTITAQTWYHYKDKPFITRREPYNLSTISRDFSQKYPTCDWIGSTNHHVFCVSEGDGSNNTGIDRSIRYKRALADDPTVKANWVADSPVNTDGDIPAFIDSSALQYNAYSAATTYSIGNRVRTGTTNKQVWESLTNGNIGNTPTSSPSHWDEVVMWDGNQCWMMSVVEHGGYQYGIYVGNRFIANRYGVGMIVSNDELETYTRFESPIIAESATFAAYYCHVHPTKVGSFWYMFVQNYVPSLLVEGHLYCCQIWRTSSDPNPAGTWAGWTKISGNDDVLSGRGYGGAVDISTSWDDTGKFRAFISPNETGQDGGYNARSESLPADKTTFPVGNKILEIEWTDWTTFKDEHYVVREIYQSPQIAEIEIRSFCPKRTFGSDSFTVSMGFLWKCQTRLGGISQNEPMNDGSILSTDLNLTNAIQIDNDIYPDWVKFGMPHQSRLDDTLGGTPQPRNIFAQTNGTVVGSPRIGRLNSIQPVDGGFVTFPNSEFLYDANYLAFKIIMDETTLSTTYGIAGMDTDQPGGQHGWHIRKAGLNVAEVWVYGSDNVSYKRYRVTISSNKANNDSALMNMIGFEFKNGVLKVRVDYNLDCTVTKLRDDSFTTLNVTDEPLRVGAIYPTTTDEMYSQGIVGSFIMLSGVANVTDEHYLNNNLLGY